MSALTRQEADAVTCGVVCQCHGECSCPDSLSGRPRVPGGDEEACRARRLVDRQFGSPLVRGGRSNVPAALFSAGPGRAERLDDSFVRPVRRCGTMPRRPVRVITERLGERLVCLTPLQAGGRLVHRRTD